jgi:hypothetical protein
METNDNDKLNIKENDDTTPVVPQVKLVDVDVKNEVIALNMIVSFLNLAQRRGSFTIDESAKIFECLKKFQK